MKDIAQMVEDSDPLVRCDALIALGILDAKEYSRNMAAHLQDKEAYVSAYAAVALLIMGDQTHSKDIVQVVGSEIASDGQDTTGYFRRRIKLHSVLAERQRQLTQRAADAWERLRLSESKLQNGAANGSQPFRSQTNRTSSAAGSRR